MDWKNKYHLYRIFYLLSSQRAKFSKNSHKHHRNKRMIMHFSLEENNKSWKIWKIRYKQ